MNLKERFDVFLQTIEEPLPAALEALKQECLASDIPIIGSGVQRLLMTLMELAGPARILELGSAYGFSALLMAHFDHKLNELITVENNATNYIKAKQNIENSDFSDKITLLNQDAEKAVTDLAGTFDFCFMDASKGQYAKIWPILRDKVKPGGIVLTDDILHPVNILESRFAIRRRDRTTHKRMREFLKAQMQDDAFVASCLHIDDGITLLVKKQGEDNA